MSCTAAVLGTWYLVRAETAILLLQVPTWFPPFRPIGTYLFFVLRHNLFCFSVPFFSFLRSPPGPAKKKKKTAEGGTMATGGFADGLYLTLY